jgi:hypothetical protein
VVKRRVGDDPGTWMAAMAVQRESQARDGCQFRARNCPTTNDC